MLFSVCVKGCVKVQIVVLPVKVQIGQLCYWSYNPAVDNSDSPSIVEELSQGLSFNCYTFISDCSYFSDVSYALCLVPSFLQHG